MFATILEIITKIGKLLHKATAFNITILFAYLICEIFDTILLLFLFGIFARLTLMPFDFTDIRIIGIGLLFTFIRIMYPKPGHEYKMFKRFIVLKLLVKRFKKKHFDINCNTAEMAQYYQRLADEVLTKYYNCNEEDNKCRLQACIVHQMRDDKLPEEKRKAVCQELELLEVDETISKFESIFEEYKKECKKMNKSR